jgi:16S rRNA (uracil1498-N3)-methyltransferase
VSFPAGAAAHVIVDHLDDPLIIDGAAGHHLVRVRRLRTGETVTAADGAGAWRAFTVTAVGAGTLTLSAAAPQQSEPVVEPRLAVAFCLTKGHKPDTVIEKITELGVDRIVPVTSERSIVRWDAGRAAAAHERWMTIACAASEQSRRARLPRIELLAPVAALADHAAVVVADPAAPDGLEASVLDPPGGEVLLLVGPEGGLAPADLAGLRPWRRLALGPTVLRAETAAIAAASAVAAARWARFQPRRGSETG